MSLAEKTLSSGRRSAKLLAGGHASVRYDCVVSLAARGSKVWLLGPPRRRPDCRHDRSARPTAAERSRLKAGPCIPETWRQTRPRPHAGPCGLFVQSGMMAWLSLSTNGGRSSRASVRFTTPVDSMCRPDERRADLAASARAAVLYRRRRRRAAAHDRHGPSLAGRAANSGDPAARLARVQRRARVGAGACARRGRTRSRLRLADDRRRRNLAFHADSLTEPLTAGTPLSLIVGVKCGDEPPERGRVNRGRPRMISA